MDTQQIKTRLKQVKNFLKARKFDGVIKNAEDILHILARWLQIKCEKKQ